MCSIKIREHLEFLIGYNAYLHDETFVLYSLPINVKRITFLYQMHFQNYIELLQIKSWPSPFCTQIYVKNLPNDTVKRIIKYIPSLIKSMSL